jgi:hypothetical protein
MLESQKLVLIHGQRVGNGIIGDGGLRVAVFCATCRLRGSDSREMQHSRFSDWIRLPAD